METNQAEKSITKLFAIKAIRSGMFSISIIMLFFKQNGLSVQEAIMLQILFSIAAIVFELPTGYFADKCGRKKSIVYGSIISTCGYLAYANSYGFWGFLFAETILALGCGFVSGADSAMLYELQKNVHKKGAIKNEGKGSFYGQLSEGITSIIGGSIIALVSLRLPLYFDALLAFAAIPLALTLVEPGRTELKRESILVSSWRVMKYSLHEHLEIKWLIFFSAIVSASTLNMVWFIQVYWEKTQVPIWMFGILWAALQVVSAFVARHAHQIEEILGRKVSLLAMIVMPIIGYAFLSAAMTAWAGLFMILFYVTRGMNDPITKSYINGLIFSDDRATILSVRNFVGRLMFCVTGLLTGWVHDAYSLQSALALSSLIFFVGGAICLIFLKRHKAL